MDMALFLFVEVHLAALILGTITFLIYHNKQQTLKNELHLHKETQAALCEDVESTRLLLEKLTPVISIMAEVVQRIGAPPRRNDIEKKELDELPIDESMRIPIVDGVKVKYENEDRSYPVNLIEYDEGGQA